MSETWKDVYGYERLYQIRSSGRLRGRYGKIQKPIITKSGYVRYTLSKNCIEKKIMAHRLVASAFIDNHEHKPQVNHINGVKTDNRVENLEWCTNSENIKHSFKIGIKDFKGGKGPAAKKVTDVVTGKIWNCALDCAKDIGIHPVTLRNKLNGHCKNNTNLKYL